MTVNANEQWAIIRSDAPGFPRLVFVQVPEAKTVKNRLHLDLATDDMEATAKRVVELGGSVVEERSRGPEDVWTIMKDPEGNEFCIGELVID